MEEHNKELNKAFLVGDYIYMRSPERRDVEGRWYQWFNDPEVTRYLNKRGYFPNTVEEQMRFYETIGHNQNEIILSIIEKKGHQHIGVISLRPIDWIHRIADIAMVIGEKNYWSGYPAVEAMALLMDHGFSKLNLHKICGTNHEGLDFWRKYLGLLGFEEEGLLKEQFYADGKYSDIHVVGVLAKKFLALKAERGGNILGPSLEALIKKFILFPSEKKSAKKSA